MTDQQPDKPAQAARRERMRKAAEEGAAAMVDVRKDAIAVRKNMERLRAERLARDSAAAVEDETKPKTPAKKRAR